MKIGDFARLCGTRIPILQHYYKVGVLRPVYVDRFTNYRYYDPSQAVLFERIRQLKAVGFTLTEIKRILHTNCTDAEISEIFKKEESCFGTTTEYVGTTERYDIRKSCFQKAATVRLCMGKNG